ncbi:hypothetical protein GTY23_23195 [Streptomyces sp. SID5998]|nr:hypothetical protein [Streptomyces sp. SID5998]
MTGPALCALCHKPIRSAAARARRIGSRCWRKLAPAQRAAIRHDPTRLRAVLTRRAAATDQQLAFTIDLQEIL